LRKGLSELEAHAAIQQSEFEIAKRLAELTVGLEPEQIEECDLNQQIPGLPRVVLVQGCRTDSQHVHSGVSYYGVSIRESLAAFIHPNELLDGAVAVNTTQAMAYYPTTWDWQNHPLVLALYREHRRRLNFIGIILERIRYETFQAKEMIARSTAQLAATLKADAALFCWLGSGNPFVEVMLAIRACEERGIKTTLVTYEYGGKDGLDSPLLYYTDEANAVVSTGSRDRWIELAAPDKIIGPYEAIPILNYPGAPSVPAKASLRLDARDLIIGGVDNWAAQSWTCSAY
jgi:glycine reductase